MRRRQHSDIAGEFLNQAQHSLAEQHLPRVIRCLRLLSDEEIWWRPNRASNSAGNLVLHLAGNVRQWIISGLGGAPDFRQRDQEFSERGPIPRRKLINTLRKTVSEATSVIRTLPPEDLRSEHLIQGFHVTGIQAIFHVTEHFAFHSGQIQFLAKLTLGKDLGFTRLPGEHRKARAGPKTMAQI